MASVDFKKWQCQLSFISTCSCRFSSMSPVEFKRRPCRPVKFKGQGPQCRPRRIVVPIAIPVKTKSLNAKSLSGIDSFSFFYFFIFIFSFSCACRLNQRTLWEMVVILSSSG